MRSAPKRKTLHFVPPAAHFSQQLEKWAKEPFETDGFKTSFPVCKSYILTPTEAGNWSTSTHATALLGG